MLIRAFRLPRFFRRLPLFGWLWLSLLLVAAGFGWRTKLASSGRLVRQPVILIDPGHGGMDGGCGAGGPILEKELNLAVGGMVAKRLKRFGLRVAMTREDDRHLGATHRRDLLARVAKATEVRADVMICLHADWSWNSSRSGPCVFFQHDSAGGRNLAGMVQEALNGVTVGERKASLPARDLLVLRLVKCPAVLVEMGFLSNRAEAVQLATAAYQDTLAEAITIGIVRFLLCGGR